MSLPVPVSSGLTDLQVTQRIANSIADQQESQSLLDRGYTDYSGTSNLEHDIQVAKNFQTRLFNAYPNVASNFSVLSSQLGYSSAFIAGALGLAGLIVTARAAGIDSNQQGPLAQPGYPGQLVPGPDYPVLFHPTTPGVYLPFLHSRKTRLKNFSPLF